MSFRVAGEHRGGTPADLVEVLPRGVVQEVQLDEDVCGGRLSSA